MKSVLYLTDVTAGDIPEWLNLTYSTSDDSIEIKFRNLRRDNELVEAIDLRERNSIQVGFVPQDKT